MPIASMSQLENFLEFPAVNERAVIKLIRQIRKKTVDPLTEQFDPRIYTIKFRFLEEFIQNHVVSELASNEKYNQLACEIAQDPTVQQALMIGAFYGSIPVVEKKENTEIETGKRVTSENAPGSTSSGLLIEKPTKDYSSGIKYREDGSPEPSHYIDVARFGLHCWKMFADQQNDYTPLVREQIINTTTRILHDIKEDTNVSSGQVKSGLEKTLVLYSDERKDEAQNIIDQVVKNLDALSIDKKTEDYYRFKSKMLFRNGPETGEFCVVNKAADNCVNIIQLEYKKRFTQHRGSIAKRMMGLYTDIATEFLGFVDRKIKKNNPFATHLQITDDMLTLIRNSLPESILPDTGWESENHFNHGRQLRSTAKGFVGFTFDRAYAIEHPVDSEAAYWNIVLADVCLQRILRVEYALIKRHMLLPKEKRVFAADILRDNFAGYDSGTNRFAFKKVELEGNKGELRLYQSHNGTKTEVMNEQKYWKHLASFEDLYINAEQPRPFDDFAKSMVDFAIGLSSLDGSLFRETTYDPNNPRHNPTDGVLARRIDNILGTDQVRKESSKHDLATNRTLQYVFTKGVSAISQKHIDDPQFVFGWSDNKLQKE